jgi:hypothetical protein
MKYFVSSLTRYKGMRLLESVFDLKKSHKGCRKKYLTKKAHIIKYS